MSTLNPEVVSRVFVHVLAPDNACTFWSDVNGGNAPSLRYTLANWLPTDQGAQQVHAMEPCVLRAQRWRYNY